jgi:hypothetical protein
MHCQRISSVVVGDVVSPPTLRQQLTSATHIRIAVAFPRRAAAAVRKAPGMKPHCAALHPQSVHAAG